MLEIRKLSLREVRTIYDSNMHGDFPESELRPFSSIRDLFSRGLYDCLALYCGTSLAGYAFFAHAENGKTLLLDYLAILPAYRGQGYGSRFLSLLREAFAGRYSAWLIEAEDPADAQDDKDYRMRERRIRFYLSNGCVRTDSECLLFGVRYTILALLLSEETTDSEGLHQELVAIYRTMFSRAVFRLFCHPKRKENHDALPNGKEPV